MECPALSPDGTRLAFKKRNPGPTITWRVAVLDLATMKEHVLAERRDVDDQVAWLDDATVMYGLAGDVSGRSAEAIGVPILGTAAPIAADTWTVAADGSGKPALLVKGAWSTVPVTTAALTR